MANLRLNSFACVFFAALVAPALAAPLNVVGTGDGLEILQELAKAYETDHPGASVLVPPSIGSGGAIAAVGAGRERIGRVARTLTPVEAASGLVVGAAFDIPSTFYVHRSVNVRALTSAQLRGIFEGKITNWSALGGPNLRIRVVRREEADSNLTVLRASLPEFRDIVMTERSKLALTTQDAVASVRDNEGAIGFAPYSVETAALLGVVSVDGHAPTSARYPAKVRLSLIWREGRLDDDIQGFVRFIASPKGRRMIEKHGAVPAAP